MKKLLLHIILCFVAINTYSQEIYTAVGLRGAIGISKLSGMKNYESAGIIPGSGIVTAGPYKSNVLPTWDIGFTIQHGRNNFVVQVDYLATYQNTGLRNANINETDKMKRITGLYANLAANFGSKWIINDNYRLIFGLGPYVGVDFFGLIEGRDRSYGKNSGDYPYDGELEMNDADYKKFDFGGSILLGIEYQEYQFALNYYHGLNNIVYDDSPLYNRALKLSVVYFF
jgi:hypothetical protein